MLSKVDRAHRLQYGLGNQIFRHTCAGALKQPWSVRTFIDLGAFKQAAPGQVYQIEGLFEMLDRLARLLSWCGSPSASKSLEGPA